MIDQSVGATMANSVQKMVDDTLAEKIRLLVLQYTMSKVEKNMLLVMLMLQFLLPLLIHYLVLLMLT